MRLLKHVYIGSVVLSLLAIGSMVGCAGPGARPPAELAPRSLQEVRQNPVKLDAGVRPPKLGLALGGGGLRGFAHLGVLRALEEEGIRADIVVGTSAGAVVGAAYASGLRPDDIEAIARGLKVSSLIDFTLFSKGGLMRGNHIASWIDTITAGRAMENFPRRFAAVATDLQSGQAVLLDRGSAGAAVQASAAVPGVNIPVGYRGGHLVDGGIASLVPVRFARALGADIVIAVDIYCAGAGDDGVSAPAVLLRSMRAQSCLVAGSELAEADVHIAPAVKVPGMSSRDEQERAIAAGYEAAHAALPRIRALLAGERYATSSFR